MEVSLQKTQIIVFHNGGNLRHYENRYFRKTPINVVSVYKYMGVYFTPTLSWSSTHDKLSIHACKALLCIKQYQNPFGYFPHNGYFKLFDSLVKPVLCYASQVWGFLLCKCY